MQSIRPPDKFNMVDMEGIDLLEVQGETISGLYNKLVESIAQCRYQCVYNWSFNGILIPPTYVEMKEREDGVWINEGVMVDEEDVVHLSVEEHQAIIVPLSVTENGIYSAPSDVDGYDPVSVTVPGPNLESKEITENGEYLPSQGYDGFSSVSVSVEGSAPVYTNGRKTLRDPYVTETANEKLAVLGNRTFNKKYDGAAYGVVVKVSGYAGPCLVSTLGSNNVIYTPPSSYTPVTIQIDGVTWYYMCTEYAMPVTPTESGGSLRLFNIDTNYQSKDAAVTAFVNYLMSLPEDEIDVYIVTSSGLFEPPDGYSGFGPIYVQ